MFFEAWRFLKPVFKSRFLKIQFKSFSIFYLTTSTILSTIYARGKGFPRHNSTTNERITIMPRIFDLAARFDSRASFYGKAKVLEDDDGTVTLLSYNTPVARICNGKFEKLPQWDCSLTTRRHVREFMRQYGFED